MPSTATRRSCHLNVLPQPAQHGTVHCPTRPDPQWEPKSSRLDRLRQLRCCRLNCISLGLFVVEFVIPMFGDEHHSINSQFIGAVGQRLVDRAEPGDAGLLTACLTPTPRPAFIFWGAMSYTPAGGWFVGVFHGVSVVRTGIRSQGSCLTGAWTAAWTVKVEDLPLRERHRHVVGRYSYRRPADPKEIGHASSDVNRREAVRRGQVEAYRLGIGERRDHARFAA